MHTLLSSRLNISIDDCNFTSRNPHQPLHLRRNTDRYMQSLKQFSPLDTTTAEICPQHRAIAAISLMRVRMMSSEGAGERDERWSPVEGRGDDESTTKSTSNRGSTKSLRTCQQSHSHKNATQKHNRRTLNRLTDPSGQSPHTACVYLKSSPTVCPLFAPTSSHSHHLHGNLQKQGR